jgi:adenosylcobinamide-GDP ribazoletransferase
MIASVLVTGAFHEDGFADVCDGFGGGWTKENLDERQCNWRGAIGLILLLLLKYQGLTQLIAVPENPTFIIYNSQFTIFTLLQAILSVD